MRNTILHVVVGTCCSHSLRSRDWRRQLLIGWIISRQRHKA